MKYFLKEVTRYFPRQRSCAGNYICLFCCILCLLPGLACAQTIPKDGSALNYRIVGFSFPETQNAANYKVEVALGSYNNEDSFQKHISVTAASKNNKIIAEVPYFGKQYTWRSITIDDQSKVIKSGLHHFSTQMVPDVNPDSVRLRIIDTAVKYGDNYVFVDGNKVLYDMKGNPVWFFPAIDTFTRKSMHLRDVKVSPFGTITAIISECIFEISYNGDVLWNRPGKNKITNDSIFFEVYHHDFIRLKNGHYMAMAFEKDWWQLPAPVDSLTFLSMHDNIRRDKNNVYSQRLLFATVVEYDQQGNVVWKWNGSDYFKKSDIHLRMTAKGLFDLNDTHANSCYFDEQTKTVCIGFRDINRLIKIQYPSGKVLQTYGTLYDPANKASERLSNNLYCAQHSGRLTDEGNVYLFNNNKCHRQTAPTVLVLKQPRSGKDTLEKIWEFECPIDMQENIASTRTLFYFGGNAIELPDKSFFVCMGGIYGKTFIVNRDKKILWCAQPEKWDPATNNWTKHGALIENHNVEGVYRASIITRKEMESLVWGQKN